MVIKVLDFVSYLNIPLPNRTAFMDQLIYFSCAKYSVTSVYVTLVFHTSSFMKSQTCSLPQPVAIHTNITVVESEYI